MSEAADAEERVLEAAATELAKAALQEGLRILRVGSPTLKLRLIQGVFARIWASVGTTGSHALADLRSELSDLFASISTDATDPESIYAPQPEPVPADGEADHQEEGPGR